MPSFLTLQQELADRLNLDQTVTANGTRLKRWINLTQNDIASRAPWDWLYARAYIQTVADETTGTVAVANGGTTVTGTSTAFIAADKRGFIQLQGDTNWYEVTVVASQVLTITPAFAGTTLTTGTYTLRRVYYDLPNDCSKVFDVRQSSTPNKLTALGIHTFDRYQPNPTRTGPPAGYYTFRLDPDTAVSASKQTQISFFPVPDDKYNIEIRYFLNLTDLSADTDIPFIPPAYHSVIIDGAEWLGSKFLNDYNEPLLKQSYELSIQKMIDNDSTHGDWMPVLGSTDSQINSRFLPFPAAYEQPQ